MKLLYSIIFILISQFILAQESSNKKWKQHSNFQGINIEYRQAICKPDNGREQILLLFRYTNTTQDKVELTWKVEVWRNNICTNCKSNSNEHNRLVTLKPNEVIEADGSTKRIKYNYIFGNFSKLVRGMNKQKLTDFKFQNLTKKIIQ
jgi:hypothetical protein